MKNKRTINKTNRRKMSRQRISKDVLWNSSEKGQYIKSRDGLLGEKQ